MRKVIAASLIFLLSLLLLGCTQAPQPQPTAAVSPEPTLAAAATPTPVEQPAIERESKIPADAVKMTPEIDSMPPQLDAKFADEYAAPVPLPAPLNTAGAEDSPFVMPDGKTLYVFFTPDVRVPVEKQLLDGVTGIYASKKQADGTWGKPQRVVLQDADKLALDGCEFVQGNTMWFCSAREGYTGVNLFTAEFKNGKWTDWQYVGDKLVKEYQVGEMHISADGSELYFHSPRAGGKGQLDIWVSRKTGGEWNQPENVAALNSEENEGWPFVTQDGKQLWFTRFYQGSPAIFKSEKTNGEWQTPELVVSQFAGEPTLDDKGNVYFTHHFYKDGKMVEADIYAAYKK